MSNGINFEEEGDGGRRAREPREERVGGALTLEVNSEWGLWGSFRLSRVIDGFRLRKKLIRKACCLERLLVRRKAEAKTVPNILIMTLHEVAKLQHKIRGGQAIELCISYLFRKAHKCLYRVKQLYIIKAFEEKSIHHVFFMKKGPGPTLASISLASAYMSYLL